MSTAPIPNQDYPGWLLAVRGSTEIRSDLRKAGQPALEQYSYRHLCRWWTDQPYLKEPVLPMASAAAQNFRIPQGSNRFGRMARTLTLGVGGMAADGVEGRLIAVQRMHLLPAHRFLGALLTAADNRRENLDWFQLWATYRHWDNPSIDVQRRVRRKLLTDYYAQPSTKPVGTDSKAVTS